MPLSTFTRHPNFPDKLNIHASVPPSSPDQHANSRGACNAPSKSAFDSQSQEAAIGRYGIAGRVWEAAYLLTQYVSPPADTPWEFDPPCSIISSGPVAVIELGSGTGYVGISLMKTLFKLRRPDDIIVLTDLPDVCSLLEENLQFERQRLQIGAEPLHVKNVKVKPLSWGNTDHARQLAAELGLASEDVDNTNRSVTHIICSDLVYFPHLLAPLMRCLLHVTSPPFVSVGQSPEVIMSYEVRSLSKESPFWSVFGLWFTFEPLLSRPTSRFSPNEPGDMDQDTTWQRFGSQIDSDGPAFVFLARRRLESYAWVVPEDDEDLMAGVGSWGMQTKKSDDTFETLLLMIMNAG